MIRNNNKLDTHICQAHTYTNRSTSTDNLNVTFAAIDANKQDKQKEREREGQLYLLYGKQYFDTQIYYRTIICIPFKCENICMHAARQKKIEP